jgi:hypothetical protein
MANFSRIMVIVVLLGAYVNASDRSQTIEGVAVAFSSSHIIYNGYVHADVLIAKSHNGKPQNKIICVSLSVKAAEWLDWIAVISSVKQFHVRPANRKEIEVIEHNYLIDEATGVSKEFPYWKILSEGENIQIPYGQKVPTYDSLDWPVRPVI